MSSSSARPLVVAVALIVVALAGAWVSQGSSSAAAATPPSTAAAHHAYGFHGTVTRTDPSHRWIQIRTGNDKLVRIQIRRATHWRGCNWGEMHHGHLVAVSAYKSRGSWIATTISDWHRATHRPHHADDHH